MAEARTYQRYDFLAMAVIKAENGRKVNISTLVENISKKGVCLHTYQPLEPDSNVVLELTFTTRSGRKAKAYIKGSVARLTREDDVNIIGVSFDDEITADNHPVLYKYFNKGTVRMVIKNK
jgi:ribosomal protein S12